MRARLRMTGWQHQNFEGHLYPGDGLEALAFATCGVQVNADVTTLLVRHVHLVPYGECRREENLLEWRTERLEEILAEAVREGLTLLKLHSHPGGYEKFSRLDDASDAEVFGAFHDWTRAGLPAVSAVMLPGGRLFGRSFFNGRETGALERVSVVGEDLKFWDYDKQASPVSEITKRTRQVFGGATTELIGKRSVAVVGASGTGSLVIQQLGHLGVERLVVVDPDYVDDVNLGRIVHATARDAVAQRLKVEVQRRFIEALPFGTEVVDLPTVLAGEEAIRAIASCDVVIGCMDQLEGRHQLNRLAAFYSLPYIDVGVHVESDGDGGVSELCGAVHYLLPGGSTLQQRGVYTQAQLDAAVLLRENPAEYEKRRDEGYLHGVSEERPAVITLNSRFAAQAVEELLMRLHAIRSSGNGAYAMQSIDLVTGLHVNEPELDVQSPLARFVGCGDQEQLLGLPALSVAR